MNLTFDQFMGSLCLFREARGSSVTTMNAIWWVLNNRSNDAAGRWPKFISDVVMQPGQFSSFNSDDPNSGTFPLRKHAADWSAYQNCMLVVSNPLGNDPTNGANSYHAIPDAGYTYKKKDGTTVTIMPPSWADPAKLTLQLGDTKFYKL